MKINLEKLGYLFYYKLFLFVRVIDKKDRYGFNDLRVKKLIALVEIIIFGILLFQFDLNNINITIHDSWVNIIIVCASVVMVVINEFAWNKKVLKKYISQFEKYSRAKNIYINIFIICFILFIIGLFLLSLHQLHLV